MKKFLPIALCWVALASHAQTQWPVGDFTHRAAVPENAPVWRVKPGIVDYAIISRVGEPTSYGKQLRSAERRTFWRAMGWPESAAEAANCIGSSYRRFCYAPPEARAVMPELKGFSSDYFFHDDSSGLMEIVKLPWPAKPDPAR